MKLGNRDIQQCPNGHTYNPKKNSSCPYCPIDDLNINTADSRGVSSRKAGITERTRGAHAISDGGKTERATSPVPGADPIVGWLVCIKGSEQGKDYRIRSEGNFIGRSSANHITIKGDNSISREPHAVIIFDPITCKFWLNQGKTGKNTYCNDNLVLNPIELNTQDVIKVGTTELMFMAFCSESFNWNNQETPIPGGDKSPSDPDVLPPLTE